MRAAARRLNRMEQRWQRLFGQPFRLPFAAETGWSPSVELAETETAIDVTAELPGVNRDDISTHLEDGVLTIQGTKKEEKQEEAKEHYLYERFYGSSRRSFALPAQVAADSVTAEFREGVLRIHMEKVVKNTTRKIEIRT